MELYREFFSIIEALNKRELKYSVVGGIALAFHAEPRFTKDIDILAKPIDLPVYEEVFQELGYYKFAEPWTFENTNITLHRFSKLSVEDDKDMIVVDLLIGNEGKYEEIINNSITDISSIGKVYLAQREDLIWMKKIRGSKQDEADIEKLENKNEQD
jgi:hypothetical protein